MEEEEGAVVGDGAEDGGFDLAVELSEPVVEGEGMEAEVLRAG